MAVPAKLFKEVRALLESIVCIVYKDCLQGQRVWNSDLELALMSPLFL